MFYIFIILIFRSLNGILYMKIYTVYLYTVAAFEMFRLDEDEQLEPILMQSSPLSKLCTTILLQRCSENM